MAAERKQILHFIESGGLYGAERVILNLSRAMQGRAEFWPVVGCIVSDEEEQSDLYDEATRQGIDAIKIVIPNARLPIALPRAARLLKDKGIQLIHSHGYKPSVYGFAIRAMSGIPVIATCHLWFEMDNGPLKTRLMIWLEKWVYRRYPKVIGVSEDICRTLIDNGVAPSRTLVVENGVDLPERTLTADRKRQLRKQLGVPEDAFCVLNAGRLTRQKGQWTLVEAAGQLSADQNAFHFLIAGEGKLRGLLEQAIVSHGVEKQVALLGFRSDIQQLLEISDALVLPSLDEGMPMVLLEAVAMEVPVVATEVGDIPKLIIDGQSGTTIPKENPGAVADALRKLDREPEFARALAREAYQMLVQKYSSEAMHRRYDAIYRDLFGMEPC
jgi:glycosyltransferase involved in cell wall biosynthesis